ncbi:MAG: hypothetical protein RLN62_02730 [Rickettsiales bacterium]
MKVKKELERREGYLEVNYERKFDELTARLESNEKKLRTVVTKEVEKETHMASTIASRLVDERAGEGYAPSPPKVEEYKKEPEVKPEIKKELISKAQKIGEAVRKTSETEPVTPKKPKKKFVNRFAKKRAAQARS